MKYEDILPKDSQCRVVLNKSDFMNSIERASLLAKVGKNNLIKLDIKANNMEITSKSEEGTVKEEISGFQGRQRSGHRIQFQVFV